MYAGMPKDSQTDRLDGVWIAVVAFTEESWVCRFCIFFIQEGEFDTPLLESFRNGDSAPDSTRFGFFKVIFKIGRMRFEALSKQAVNTLVLINFLPTKWSRC